MKTIKFLIGLFAMIVLIAMFTSCTKQQRVRNFGGTMTEKLPVGQKLVMATWKDGNDLWILTRNMKDNESPETYTFKESSSFGVWQGTVIFIESK
jgi:hypothetical protein